MAIDSENKRASAANLFLFNVPPVPNTDIDAADRAHLDIYSGMTTIPVTYFMIYIWKRTA